MVAQNKFLEKQIHKNITQIKKGGIEVIIKKTISLIKFFFQIPI